MCINCLRQKKRHAVINFQKTIDGIKRFVKKNGVDSFNKKVMNDIKSNLISSSTQLRSASLRLNEGEQENND